MSSEPPPLPARGRTELPPVLIEKDGPLPPVLAKKRYHDLDALRAFAMLLGIALHGLLSFMPGSGWPGQDIHQSEFYGIVMSAIHGFRMPLFFLVSGFFTAMMWRNRGLGGLFKHRVQRVVLPLVVFLCVLTPMMMVVAIFGAIKSGELARDADGELARDAIGELAQGPEVAALLKSEGASSIPGVPRLGPAIEQLPGWAIVVALVLCFSPVFHHLWFLYYLVWLVLGFLAAAWVIQKLKWKSVPGWFVASPLRLLWLLPVTFVPQFFMTMAFGADTAAGLVPWPPKLLYYAIFFGFGALCFGQEDFERKVGRLWPLCLVLAVPALLFGLHWLTVRGEAFAANEPEFMASHILCTGFTVLYTWLMIFGLIGFFRLFFSGEHPRIRYISDSSYWLYLMHLPLIMFLQILVSDWPYPSFVKFIGICAVTGGIMLVLYEYMVRYTWIGTMLNGKKTRSGSPGRFQGAAPTGAPS